VAEGVKQFKDFTITYSSSVLFVLDVYTDLPGGTLTLARTFSLASTGSTTTRKTITIPFDATPATVLEGKLIKFKISAATPAGAAILYEASVRVRVIGEYLDGSAGDIWETQPLSLGA
jgi:hypothetical protein